jgi:molybdopterin-guanine dinucleotide biosynthesis protein A
LRPDPTTDPPPPELPLGVILAGGTSTRFGSPKALARLGGRAVAERVRDVLAAVVPDPVAIANDPGAVAGLGLPVRPDRIPGGGPLSGLHAGLRWAEERGRRGILCVACDMPFLSVRLLEAILARSRGSGADGVAPESGSRHGFEPLCAWYGIPALGEIEARLRRGPAPVGDLRDALALEILPLAEVRAFGDPDILFLNVNRMADLRRAEAIHRHGEGG